MFLKNYIFFILALGAVSSSWSIYYDEAIEFEIIIPSYNNARWCLQNITSAVKQNYPHFHITYIDDCSTDGTGQMIDAFVAEHNLHSLVRVIHNKKRCGAMANWYYAISSCPDHKVIVNLDGDDMLAHANVLTLVANVYKNYDVWLTYGQFTQWPNIARGWCKKMPDEVVAKNTFRDYVHMPSHLRTFYAWLFKKIKVADLMHEGTFFTITCDQAMMFPMIEMAGFRHAFIKDIIYLYNAVNDRSDHVADEGKKQTEISKIIRAKTKYQPLLQPEISLTPNKPAYRKTKKV